MVDIQDIMRIVKKDMQDLEGSAHSYEHVERVFKIATFIAKKENADLERVKISSLLHDIGRTIGEPHAEKGMEPARKILYQLDVPKEEIARILRIVRYHDVEGRDKLQTQEEKIVWDADKIDLIGLTGVSRAFHFAGQVGTPFNNAVEWCSHRSLRQPYEFFTVIAQNISVNRFEAMRRFTLQLEKELSLTDIEEYDY